MSYEFYKVLHLLGVLVLFVALGGLSVNVLRGGTDTEAKPVRKSLSITHGVALLVVFVAGFGLMARTNIAMGTVWPLWIWVKVGVWVALGASVVLIRRTPGMGRLWLYVLPLVGAVAAFMCVTKPT
jgi:hypothetical protein